MQAVARGTRSWGEVLCSFLAGLSSFHTSPAASERCLTSAGFLHWRLQSQRHDTSGARVVIASATHIPVGSQAATTGSNGSVEIATKRRPPANRPRSCRSVSDGTADEDVGAGQTRIAAVGAAVADEGTPGVIDGETGPSTNVAPRATAMRQDALAERRWSRLDWQQTPGNQAKGTTCENSRTETSGR